MTSGLSKGLLQGLESSEKMFQARMRRIYEKYNQAFEDDIVVNIIEFTYSSPDGPVPWDCEAKIDGNHRKGKTTDWVQQSAYIQVLPIECSSFEILEEALNATCVLPMEASDGIFSRTFIIGEKSENRDSDFSQLQHYENTSSSTIKPYIKEECIRGEELNSYATGNLSPSINLSAGTKETCFTDGHKRSLMPYTGSNIGNKTFFVSPLDTSVPVQIKSFIRRQNKDCSFEDTRDISYDNQADESRIQNFKEAAYCDSGNNSLAYYYPDMVECIRRLWELPWKKSAADNIVHYYRRHVWNCSKKKATKQMFHRSSNSRNVHLHPLRKNKAFKACSGYIQAPQSKNFKKSSFVESVVHSPRIKQFTANSAMDSSSIHSSSIHNNFCTKQIQVDVPDIRSCMKEQNRQISVKQSPVRRNICSLFPLMHSPKAKLKTDCKILDKTFTYQNQIETDDANFSSSSNDISQLLEVSSVLSSSQRFPMLHSPINDTVTLSPSKGSKTTTLYKPFIKQNQEKNNSMEPFFFNNSNKQSFMYKKQPENCHVDASFQENVKLFPKMVVTPPRLSPGKHSAVSRLDPIKTSLDNTFTFHNAMGINEVKSLNIKEKKKPFPGSSFSAFPVLQSPRKDLVALSSSMEVEMTDLYKSFFKQNQLESGSCYRKEQKSQTFKYIKQTPDVKPSFQENKKWFPKMAVTPPKMNPGKHSVMLNCRINPFNTSLHNTFICQNSVEGTEVKSFDRKEQDKKPSHKFALKRRNSFSALPSADSPTSSAKSFRSLNATLSLDQTISYQDDLKTVQMAASCNREHTSRFLKREDSMPRCDSFSPLPVVCSFVREKKIPDVLFEDVWKMDNRNGFHPNVRLQSSEMVLSLVNSPGSLRYKRRASKNLSFSKLKRQKSADETFIQSVSNTTRHSVDKSSVLWRETSHSLPKSSPKFSGWS